MNVTKKMAKALMLLVLAGAGAAPAATPPPAPARYIIRFKTWGEAQNAVRATGITPVVQLAPQNAVSAYLTPDLVSLLLRNPAVAAIEVDPPRYLMGQTIPYGIPMVQADQLSDGAAGNTTVCIIDSGYYRDHEDLQDTNVDGSFDSGTGNWYEDTCAHGSHVAGTISALNNAYGVAGVMSSGNINLWIEKVFTGAACGFAYSSDLVHALNSCRTHATTPRLVVSMSLGGPTQSFTESNAFQSAFDAGVLSVAAAGNAGTTAFSYPASYPSVISVAAVDSNKVVASFSQKNSQVELAAPGVAVLSTVPIAPVGATVDGVFYEGADLAGSSRTSASGNLVDGGLCDSVGAWTGLVVLCQRGNISFAAKVANVVSGGGVAALVYNNVSGNFLGTLNGSSTIPALSLSMEDGSFLVANKLGFAAAVTDLVAVGNGYAFYDGTSMATPHVSGVAALVWSLAPDKSNEQLREALRNSALDLGAPGRDDSYGYGLVQAKAALDAINTPPSLAFSASSYKASEAAGQATLTVVRKGDTTVPLNVSYLTSAGTATAGKDFTATSGTLTFAAGVTMQAIGIPVHDDMKAEGPETFGVSLSSPVGATLGDPAVAVVTIRDNDAPAIYFDSATYSVSEAGPTVTVVIKRSGVKTAAASATIASEDVTASGGSDFKALLHKQVNFAAGVGKVLLQVPITDDAEIEGDETFRLHITAATGAAIGTQNTTTVTIVDND